MNSSQHRQEPRIILLGDEDRAALLVPKALSLFSGGASGEHVEDDSIIAITGDIITIETTHHAPISLFSPLDTVEDPTKYRLWLLGCSHRKDATLTSALFNVIATDYEGFPRSIGPELIYMTDGVAFIGCASVPYDQAQLRAYWQFIGMLGIAGITEDTIQQGTGTVVGPQGVKNATAQIAFVGANLLQGDNFYSAAPYGVDRTDVAAPKYRFIVGGSIHTSGSPLTTTWYFWDNENSIVDPIGQSTYYLVNQVFVYLTAQRGSAPTAYYYTLGQDIVIDEIDYDINSGAGMTTFNLFYSAPFPIVIPLGNQRVVIVYRERTADSSLIWGGSFSIKAKLISGMSMTQSAYDIEAMKTLLLNASFDFGPTGNASTGGAGGWPFPYYGNDPQTAWWLMESLAVRARAPVPVSQDETLIIMFQGRNSPYVDPPESRVQHKQVCYSFTPDGVTQKSTLVSYWGHMDGGTKDYFYSFGGACHMGGQRVLALFSRLDWNGSVWVDAGYFRFLSEDDGTTWVGPTAVTFTNDADGDAAGITGEYVSPNVVYIGPKLDAEGEFVGDIVCVGFADKAAVTGATKLKNPKLMTSEDGGLTFFASKSGGAGRELTWLDGYYYYHTSRGVVSAHLTGDAVDGFDPSPYRHLPTYYGTPSKACRVIDDTGQ